MCLPEVVSLPRLPQPRPASKSCLFRSQFRVGKTGMNFHMMIAIIRYIINSSFVCYKLILTEVCLILKLINSGLCKTRGKQCSMRPNLACLRLSHNSILFASKFILKLFYIQGERDESRWLTLWNWPPSLSSPP